MHTPGPWKIFDGYGSELRKPIIVDSLPDVEGRCVANCICYLATTNDDYRANALLIAAAPEMRELLECVAMSPIDLENDGECCMRIKTETIFKIASLVFGEQITEIQTLAGQLVTSADQTSAREET